MKRALQKIIALLAAMILAAAVPVAAPAEEGETRVVILATSDMHGNIWGYSYENNEETTNNGMARMYSYISKVREEEPLVFLIDGGDEIQGTILTDDISSKTPEAPHPVMEAMNYMGYDAMTLGNHEFDWGVDAMLKITGQAAFPVLAENARGADGKPVTGQGWTIIERGGVKLAVIGVVTPDVPIWDGQEEGVGAVTFEAADAAVKRAVAEIGDKADLIMVSAHMGEYAEYDEDSGSDSAIRIAEENTGIDILQVAHMHITVNDEHNAIPTAGVRNAGREIARFDVTLDGNRRITDIQVSIVDMADYEPSAEIRDIPLVKETHEQAIQYISGGGDGDGDGGSAEPLGSTTAKFQPENEIRGLPEGRLRDTAVIDLILKVQLENSGADVTSCSLFRDTSDLPAGEITYKNIFDIYMYDNTLCRMTVTGRELKNYMEWAVECYNQWLPGDINISFDPDCPGYLHDIFGGVEYEVDLSRPKGERIQNVMFRGAPLADDETLTLAVNSYRYASFIKPLNLAAGKRDWESSRSVRDMIVDYFAEHSPVAPETDGNWRITGVDLGTDDPRRAELIGWINEGKLPVPYNQSYNLADYEKLAAEAAAGQ